MMLSQLPNGRWAPAADSVVPLARSPCVPSRDTCSPAPTSKCYRKHQKLLSKPGSRSRLPCNSLWELDAQNQSKHMRRSPAAGLCVPF